MTSFHTHADELKIAALTTLALVAFAANSVLCRLALNGDSIDAAGFTVIRLLAGVVVLAAISALQRRITAPAARGALGGVVLLAESVTHHLFVAAAPRGTTPIV